MIFQYSGNSKKIIRGNLPYEMLKFSVMSEEIIGVTI